MRLPQLVLGSSLLLLACGDNATPPPATSVDGGTGVPDVLTFDPNKIPVPTNEVPEGDGDSHEVRDAGNGSDGGDGDGDDTPVATYTCKGIADSCSLKTSSATCSDLQGCAWEEACSGTPKSCSNQISQFTCIPIDGCVWYSSGYGYCGGPARACSRYSASGGCTDQGCQWKGACEGVSSGCSLLTTEGSCTKQGCQWERD